MSVSDHGSVTSQREEYGMHLTRMLRSLPDFVLFSNKQGNEKAAANLAAAGRIFDLWSTARQCVRLTATAHERQQTHQQ